jgi:hypothetical protein
MPTGKASSRAHLVAHTRAAPIGAARNGLLATNYWNRLTFFFSVSR